MKKHARSRNAELIRSFRPGPGAALDVPGRHTAPSPGPLRLVKAPATDHTPARGEDRGIGLAGRPAGVCRSLLRAAPGGRQEIQGTLGGGPAGTDAVGDSNSRVGIPGKI